MPMQRLAPVLHYLGQLDAHGRARCDAELLKQYVRSGDEGAFATLLKRHGPMVFGVCRRVLRNRHEAEDAFQATFLVLVRKARSLRQPELLGHWLYGVAYRTSLKAKSLAARHAVVDESLNGRTAPTSDDVLWRDLRPVLDDAINDLPTRYRLPFVLCYLQGLTNAQAARQLGCPEGTVATRLSRARQRLRVRLARHGPGVACAFMASAIGSSTASAKLPALLVVSTVRIATAFRAGPASAVPAAVATLTKGICEAMFLAKLRYVFALLVVVGAAVGGTTAWAFGTPGDDSVPAASQPIGPPAAPPAAPPVAPQAIPQREPPPGPGSAEPAIASAVVHTANFAVRASTQRIAQLVGDSAERFRKSEAIRWLGQELPTWPERCSLNVDLSGRDTGNATTFVFDAGQVKGRSMMLHAALDQVLSNYLPHEITHTVLADHFRAPLPRWADEGAAILGTDAEEQQRHQGLMHDLLHTPSRLIPLRRLLPPTNYPQDVKAFYAEAYTLARFLVERKDRRTFLAFVKEGMNGDRWDEAVKSHYGLADVAALEEAWLGQVRSEAKTQAAAQRQLRSGPPAFGHAIILEKDTLYLRSAIGYYAPAPVIGHELRYSQVVTPYALEDIVATDRDGKPIDRPTLVKRLQAETPVLLATGREPIDPYYLGVVKEGTILLTPRPNARLPLVAPPASPPPSAAQVPPQPIRR